MTDDLVFRRPIEADHARVMAVIDDWWGGRKMRAMLPRLWFQHFVGRSWIAETEDGRLMGFLVGFLSPDRPGVAYVHIIGTNPNRRKRGLGRALYERFFEDVRAAGARGVVAMTWPGNQVSVAFPSGRWGSSRTPVRAPRTCTGRPPTRTTTARARTGWCSAG